MENLTFLILSFFFIVPTYNVTFLESKKKNKDY